jgi:hypothetical protein
MPSEQWMKAWKAYQRMGLPSTLEKTGPTVRISQSESALKRIRADEARTSREWVKHQQAQQTKTKNDHLAEADRRLRQLLGDDYDA